MKTADDYLNTLTEERRKVIGKVRDVILKNLPKGIEEGICYNMIGYFVPHSIYPTGYHVNPAMPLPFAALASQKNYMSLYLNSLYANDKSRKWFEDEYSKSGKKLDMGKTCIRFKKLDDLPLDLIAKAVAKTSTADFIEQYEYAKPKWDKQAR